MSSTSLMGSHVEILIPMGGLTIGKEKNILKTFVGSCVALCIFDARKKIAGMAHIVLAKNITKQIVNSRQEGKFADDAINIIIERLSEISPNLELEAKMAGGATIFAHESSPDQFNIGNKNIIRIRLLLEEKKIPIVSELVGSKSGRWIMFDCNNQKLTVKSENDVKII